MSAAAEVASAAERAAVVAEAVRIARECLAGDPFRSVPALEVRARDLFVRFDGSDDYCTPAQVQRIEALPLPAYAVAGLALSTARMAGGTAY